MKFLLQEMRLFVLVLFVYFVVPVGTSTVDDIKRLLDRANSSNYDKRIRPLKNQTNALEVTLGLILYSVIDFDQPKEALSTSVQLLVQWKDELLAWEKDDYGGIDGLRFPQDDIWKPDLRLNNSYKSFTGFGSADLTLRVTYDGNVSWYPIQALESQCSVSTKHFPFDTQTCSLFFESASYPSWELKVLREGEDSLKLTYYKTNSAWDLTSTSTVEHEPRAVEFKLVLERRWGLHMVNIFLPLIFLSCLIPFIFMYPLEDDRPSFAMTLYLAFGIFLTDVASKIPPNSVEIPHLSNYILAITFFGCLSVGTSLFRKCFSEGWVCGLKGWEKADQKLFVIFLLITLTCLAASFIAASSG